jgi:hypothetical protein
VKEKLLLGISDKKEKRPAFIDEALNHAASVPSHKYEDLEAWKKSQKRSFALKIYPEGKSPEGAKKEKKPDMNSYFKPDIDKLTKPRPINHSISKLAKVTFSDIYTKTKKFVPSPQTYKIESSAFDRISRSPLSLQKRRH